MNSFTPRLFLACVIVFSALNSVLAQERAAPNDSIVLSSGVQGGGYWSAGARLQVVAEREVGLAVENLTSSGSLENLEALLDNTSSVNLAFAQADAVQHYLNQHPNELNKLELIENVGVECVFIITGIDSDIETDEDFREAKDFRLGISSPSSGIAVTYDYMVSQIPEMEDIEVSYGNNMLVMEKLNASDATVDAVMMVHRPREHSLEVDYALSNPDRYRFVKLTNARLTQELWNGRKIYRSMKLALPGASEPVQTICVLGLLLANKEKLTIEQRNQLGEIANYHWMQVYATP